MLNNEDIKRCRALALDEIKKVRVIMRQVAEESGVTIEAMKSDAHTAKVTGARQIVAFVAMREGASDATIGIAMNKNRSTIVKAARREAALREAFLRDTLTE